MFHRGCVGWLRCVLLLIMVAVLVQMVVGLAYFLSPSVLTRHQNQIMVTLSSSIYFLRPSEKHDSDLEEVAHGKPPSLVLKMPSNDDQELDVMHKSPRKWPIPKYAAKVPEQWLQLAEGSGECSRCPSKEKFGIFCLDDEGISRWRGENVRQVGDHTQCLVEGTDWNKTRNDEHICACHTGWHGPSCSLPDIAVHSSMGIQYLKNLRLRDTPRRIIYAFPFHMEFSMLEARIAELSDLVDVFLILESNFTAYGEPKSLKLLSALQQGAYKGIACKIVYVFLNFFPKEAYYEGYIADRLHRDHIGTQGVGHQLRGYRPDDIFLLTDADEIPVRQSLLFLKLHDGFPEPFGYNYQWNVYGFFWTPGRSSRFDAGMTMAMLTEVIDLSNTIDVRYSSHSLSSRRAKINEYQWKYKANVSHWDFGGRGQIAGWHCSWCFPVEGIRDKLVSAQNGDFPRWGDYQEKLELSYLQGLVRDGRWFSGQEFQASQPSNTNYAPSHIMKHPDKYLSMLKNPFSPF